MRNNEISSDYLQRLYSKVANKKDSRFNTVDLGLIGLCERQIKEGLVESDPEIEDLQYNKVSTKEIYKEKISCLESTDIVDSIPLNTCVNRIKEYIKEHEANNGLFTPNDYIISNLVIDFLVFDGLLDSKEIENIYTVRDQRLKQITDVILDIGRLIKILDRDCVTLTHTSIEDGRVTVQLSLEDINRIMVTVDSYVTLVLSLYHNPLDLIEYLLSKSSTYLAGYSSVTPLILLYLISARLKNKGSYVKVDTQVDGSILLVEKRSELCFLSNTRSFLLHINSYNQIEIENSSFVSAYCKISKTDSNNEDKSSNELISIDDKYYKVTDKRTNQLFHYMIKEAKKITYADTYKDRIHIFLPSFFGKSTLVNEFNDRNIISDRIEDDSIIMLYDYIGDFHYDYYILPTLERLRRNLANTDEEYMLNAISRIQLWNPGYTLRQTIKSRLEKGELCHVVFVGDDDEFLELNKENNSVLISGVHMFAFYDKGKDIICYRFIDDPFESKPIIDPNFSISELPESFDSWNRNPV